MSEQIPNRPNLAARAARWGADRGNTATGAWLAVVIVAAVLGGIVGTVKLTDSEQATGQTARGQQILTSAGFKSPASESVLVQSRTLTAGAARFRAAVADVTDTLAAKRQTIDVRSPYAPGADGQVSKDGHSALVLFDLRGDATTADTRVQPVLNAVAALQRAHPGLTVAEFGEASAAHELNNTIGKDFSNAERLSVPITFAILLVAFGAFVAAGVPLLLAFSGVLGSIGLAALLSHVFHASDSTSSVILLMGMAVGVDYSLFYLKRTREERARGAEPATALQRAAATSGQAVLVSGGTVLIAMAGMLFAGSKIFTSIGIGAMVVVFPGDGGVADRAARSVGKARGPRRSRLGVGARRQSPATVATSRPPATLPGRARRPAYAAAARQGLGRRVADLGPGAASGPALPSLRGARLGSAARRARAADPGHAHQALGLQRPAQGAGHRSNL
jgi:uncharacterized membrane protein YdfJ with MMPL/SSD domain